MKTPIKTPIKTLALWALVALNVVLVFTTLGNVFHENTASGQVGAARRPGEYIMIDGNIPGSTAGLVYVVDTVNGTLGAMVFNDSGPGSHIDPMPPIDLNAVFAQQLPTAPKPKRGY